MNDAFYIAAAGMRSEEYAVQVIANNIANLNTPGFKRADIRFSEVLAAGSPAIGDAARSGVRAEANPQLFQSGELRPTNNALDLAIDGQGFIELMASDGRPLLWRGGRLSVDGSGQLRTSTGLILKAPVQIPPGLKNLTIDRQGVVKGQVDGGVRDLGQIDLIMVSDASTLRALGDSTFEPLAEDAMTTMIPGAEGAGFLAQGMIEGSNVELSSEMVTLMLMQRAFAANSQVIQAADQLMAISNGLKR